MKRYLSLLLLVLCSVCSLWAETTFTAKVQGGNTVEVGSQIRVEFVLNAEGDKFSCDIAASGLTRLAGPSPSFYSSQQIINGHVTSSVTNTYTYILRADAEGTYTIPAATAVCEGKTYTSNTLTIKAIPADPSRAQNASTGGQQQQRQQQQASSGIGKDDVLLVLDLSKTSVYEGEPLTATLKLYFRNQDVSSLNDAKFPDFEGFSSQDIDLGNNVQATLEQFRGQNYRMYPVHQWLLFPLHSGEISIKPASLSAIIQVYRARRSFWDDPFSSYQNVAQALSTLERTVTVKPLPAGKPASYMNAVGDFSIKSELTADSVRANDAVIYRLTIEGTGNLRNVRDPQPEFHPDFEVYDPKSDISSRTGKNGISGKKVIEYTFIPRFGGTFQIPAVEFSYFDPKTGQYSTLHTESHTLRVAGTSDNAGGSATSESRNYTVPIQEAVRNLDSDIRYIHEIPASSLESQKDPLFGSLLYCLLLLLPLLILIVFVILNRRQIRKNADVVGQRNRKANKVATRRLKEASAALRKRDETLFYESVHKAMLGYVSDKLNIPQSELTSDSINEAFASRNIDANIVKDFNDVLQQCEFARYAPSADSQAMDSLYQRAAETIGQLDKKL